MRFNRRTFAAACAASFAIPTRSLAQQSTPQAEFEAAQNRCTQWLELLPGGRFDDLLDITWVDFERQVTAMGGDWSDSAEDRQRYILNSQFGNLPPFIQNGARMGEVLGFDMTNITQATASGRPPHAVQLMELDTDPESFTSQWESVGYEPAENDFGEFWTIGQDGDVDLKHPVQMMFIASFNNIAILDGRRIAVAPTADLLEEMVSAHRGDTENRSAELAPVIEGLPDDSASLWMLSGEEFARVVEDPTDPQSALFLETLAESDDVVGPMPMLRTLGIGTTAGVARDAEYHIEDSSHFIILETDENDAAQQAADVVLWRAENLGSMMNGEPFSDLLGELEVEIISPTVARISCHGDAAIRGMFTRMVQNNDTWIFIHQIEN